MKTMLCSRKYCLRMMVVMGILLITFGVPGKAIGQTTSTYSWGSSSTNSGTYSHANPFGRCYGWEYRVFLYPPNTLSFAGSITNLEFLPSETLSSSGGQIDVWMKTTTSVTSLSSSTSFATYKSGATHVYSNSSSPSFTANSYVSIPLSTPIAYNYNNNEYLMILVRSVANGSSGDGCTSFYYYNPSGASNNTWYAKKDGSDPGENATSGWGNNGTGAYLPVIRVTYTTGPSYCTPSFSSTTNDYISGFVLGSISNTGTSQSTNGYGDYTSMSTNLAQGATATAQLTSYTGTGTHAAAIWIDFDNNGTFASSEKVGSRDNINPSTTVDISVTIPSNAATGSHRMRVLYQYNVTAANLDPCASATHGECEDYTVNITAASSSHTLTVQANNSSYGTVKINSGTAGTSVTASLNQGGTATLHAIPANGYVFTGWTTTSGTLANANVNPTTFTMGSANATVTATFAALRTTPALSGDSGNPSGYSGEGYANLFDNATGTKYCTGSVPTVIFHSGSAIMPQGYIFTTANDTYDSGGTPSRNPKTWTISGGDSSSGPWTVIDSKSNITTVPNSNFTSSSPFNIGTRPAKAYQYYKFEVTALQSGSTFQLSEFDFIPYPITCIPTQGNSNHGYIEATWPAPASGSTVTVTIHPESGYRLSSINAYRTGSPSTTVSLSGSGTSDGSTRTFTMPSYDVTVEATFTLITYTLSWSNPTGGTITVKQGNTSVSSGTSFTPGTQLSIEATANPGYIFSGWTATGSPTIANSSSASTTLTMGTDNVVLSASFIQEIIVGDHSETTTNNYLPSYSFYCYSLTQQIYTPCEIGVTGNLNGIAFYNAGTARTRSYDIYLVTTTKESFSSTSDWITVTASDKVFSGSVTMTSGVWTWIPFSSSFYYDGTSNLVVVVDDNTGSDPGSMSCRVNNAAGYQTMRVYSDGTNYNALDPTSYTGTQMSVKNQLKFSSNNAVTRTPVYVTVSANDDDYGTVTGGGCFLAGTNTSTTVTATPNSCYKFVNWTKNGSQMSTNASYTFTVTEDVDLVANFEDEWTVNPNATNVTTECITSGTQMTLTASTDYPDAYNFSVTSGSYSDISGTSSVSGDDAYSSAISLGTDFNFNYWGENYNSVVIATNGYLRLGNGSDGYSNELQSTSKFNILAAFWDDLDATSTKYTTLGSAPNRVFVMQHNGYRHGDSSHTFTFQIRLYETTNVIEFWYGSGFPDLTSTSTSASIGLNNRANGVTSFISVTPTGSGTATTSTTTANNSIGTTQCDYLTSGTIYRFTPAVTYSWSCTSGTSGTASGNTYTVSPTASTNTYRVEASAGGCTKRADVTVTVKPADPTNLQVSSITSTTATASWTANGASSWQYNYNGTWNNTSSTSVNLTGLTAGTNYTFQVKAIDGSCESNVVSTPFTALTRHTVTYNKNHSDASGTMTDSNSPYDYGSTVTVKANTFTAPTNYVFNCWNTAADGSGTQYKAGDTFSITANTTLYAQWAPLVIANTTQWDEFCDAVNSGFDYTGETVTMTDDIGTVTTGVGTDTHPFRGTFDGDCNTLTVNISSSAQGAAPFHVIEGAIIENLIVTGTVSATAHHAGGLVGFAEYTGSTYSQAPANVYNTIRNCLVATNVTNNGSSDNYIGGIIGHNKCARTTIVGCAYTGRLTSSGYKGGMIGWSDRSTLTVTDSYFGGDYSTSNNFSPIGCKTKTQNSSNVTLILTFSNFYYNKDAGSFDDNAYNAMYNATPTGVAKHAYTLDYASSPAAGGTVSHVGSGTEYGCSGITAYTTGLAYDIDNDAVDELILGNGESATLTATANSGYTFMNWTDGSSTPTVNPYAVTMGAANRTVTANFINQTASTDWTYFVDAISDVPTGGISISSGNVTIGNREGLAWVISMVNALNGVTAEDAETFAGLTYTLTADVDMSAHTWVPIGTTEHPFSGTFNGNGHVIKGITRSTDFPHDGLFGYVSGNANIQNVVVQASLTGNSHATGAVVGTFASTGTISNVEGAGTLTGGTLTTALGGIAGNNSGTIHSSFGVATMTGGASATQMGGLVGNNTGNLYNSYSNATYAGTSATKGGLVGSNSGTVENCYAAGIASGVSAFAGSNSGSGTIQNCYTDAVGSGYIGTNSTAPTGSGTYGAVQSSIKHLDYMYRDNLIAANTNTYVGGSGVTSYVGNHIPVWNGLVSALNQWVRANPRSLTSLAPWYRPISSHINGDLPVLGFAMDNSLGTLDSDGKFLQYGSNQNGGNGLDAVLTTFNNSTASIFHYGKATGVTNVPTANVKVSIAEDAVLLQGNGAGAFTATVGVTFDNSDHGQHAYDFWGNKLNYDWHLLSTPLSNLKTGAVHSTYQASGDPHSAVDITSIGGYFPANLITPGNPAIGGAIKWDFYTYYEPEYHWINLKRNKNNHYHQDSPNGLITYSEADQDVNGTSAIYIPGKGYEMAISQDTYMNATGTLNRGDVPITLTNQEPNDINYAKGWNLVGNPYQAYLNIDAIGYDPIYTYDADQGLYVPYTKTASANPAIVSQYIHPHQAFFVRTANDNVTLRFQQSMATTTSAPESYFRDKVNYPLVNLFAEDETGHRDLTVVEFHRPELGGAAKLDYMRTAPFSLAAHYSGKSYGILFATDDIERVPVHFKPAADGLITLSWSTHNGEFSLLKLVDNKLGVEHNMLADNSYSFMASADDYSSRFYITYECSGMGIDENDEGGALTGSATFAYINNGNIVVDVGAGHGASLQVIDVLGRVLYSQEGLEGACTVSTSGLAKGVYILRLSSNQGIKTQKIVVQ